jgi:hypothetical protein
MIKQVSCDFGSSSTAPPAGSLATSGAALLGPLHALAGWLGALGGPILALLPAPA